MPIFERFDLLIFTCVGPSFLFFVPLFFFLIHSLFNADPHGGNFLLLPDGRIGLIDYGATKRLSEKERISACVMFVALQRKDKEKLWQMAKMGGYKSKHMNPDVYYKLVQFGYDTWGKEVTGGLNVQQFMGRSSWNTVIYKSCDAWTAILFTKHYKYASNSLFCLRLFKYHYTNL